MKRGLLLAACLVLLASGVSSPRGANPPDAPPWDIGAVEPGEREVNALKAAWPGRILETHYRDGDWMLRIDERWFAWAHGRLLPDTEAADWRQFAPLPFYPYPLSLPPLAVVDDQTAARLRQGVRDRQKNPPRRSEDFLSSLLQASRRTGIEDRLSRVEVAGFTLTVHESLTEPLGRVSDELRALRRADPEINAFIGRLREMNGYNYRFVEGTRSRSLHSYGLAVDLIPRSYHGKSPYWLWAMSKSPDWWTIPYEDRWMVPAGVVEAFEKQGFVWGGKWLFFDTMHFEYRPEILRLSRDAAPAVPTVSEQQS
jgi:hypothetical protein